MFYLKNVGALCGNNIWSDNFVVSYAYFVLIGALVTKSLSLYLPGHSLAPSHSDHLHLLRQHRLWYQGRYSLAPRRSIEETSQNEREPKAILGSVVKKLDKHIFTELAYSTLVLVPKLSILH